MSRFPQLRPMGLLLLVLLCVAGGAGIALGDATLGDETVAPSNLPSDQAGPEEAEIIPERGAASTIAPRDEPTSTPPTAQSLTPDEKPPHEWVSTPEEPLLEVDDHNFESVFFGNLEAILQKKGSLKEIPFLIMFYAPWCPHCTKLKPVFGNASVLAREKGQGAASFAMIDGTKSLPNMAQRYGIRVKSYPSIYYSIMGKIYPYEGSRSIQNFIYVARLLWLAAVRDYGIMDDLRQPEILRSIEAKEPMDMVSYFFALPDGPSGYRIGNSAVDAVLSIGRARYAWIPLSQWETLAKSPSNVARQVAGALLRARTCTRGPLGALLVVTSEGLKNPRPYCGGWFYGNGQNTTVSANLIDWVRKTAFPAVQTIDADTWPFLAQRGLVLVAAFPGPVPEPNSPPQRALTLLAQHINEDATHGRKDISVGVLNGIENSAFMDSVHVDRFPSLFVVNTDREEAYYLDDDLQAQLLAAPDTLWSDPQFAAALEGWTSGIMHGRATPRKYHWYGRVAAFLTQIPLVGWVHDTLSVGDLEFVAIMAMLIATPLLLFIASRGGDEPSTAATKAPPPKGKTPPQAKLEKEVDEATAEKNGASAGAAKPQEKKKTK